MIVHIFNGRQIHLVAQIAAGFITTYSNSAEHYIVIYGGSEANKKKYLELFNEHNFNRYLFAESLLKFAKFVRTIRKEAILFHAGKYVWFITALFCGAKNINWVCWGAGSAIGNNWKSKLMTPLKSFIYRHFKTIVTLMDEDKATITKDFNVRLENIRVISYAPSGTKLEHDALLDSLLEEQHVTPEKPLILLGNSPREIHNYIEMLHRLAHLRGKIRVQCMNNYSLKHDEVYYQLIATGEKLFGDDFKSNEDFYSEMPDYIRYMNTCDIYICSSITQTGLGAVLYCLRLGKKIYICGKNLSWIRNHYGAIVYDTNDITDTIVYDELITPLTIEQRYKNRESVIKDIEQSAYLWRKYIREIDKNQKQATLL